jgi:GNAT superfamily N-acetyltransferase
MIGRIREYVRAHGVRATAVQLATRLHRGLHSNERITLLLKDLDSIAGPAKRSGIAIAPIDRERLGGLSELNRRRHRRRADSRFRRDLERGMQGFVGLREGETVAYYWWVEGERAELHPDLAWLGPALDARVGDVYGSDFYVLPEHRQGGTANELLYLIESSFRDSGFRRIWGYVDSGNRQARWLYSFRGYLPMGDVTVRKLLFRRRSIQPPTLGSATDE